jgi:glycosyltransferase involved in cell wall biosynthesis
MSLPPLISIVAPAHNAARFFDSWINSIESQGIFGLEVILVDDGSSDDIAERVSRRPDGIRYLRQDNQGPAAARNAGIRASSADLIAFLDLDDRWTPRHLERCMNALEANAASGIAQGRIRNVITDSEGGLQYCSPAYRFLNLGAAVFRRSVFERCGYFDIRLRFAEDFDFITRCWEQGVRKIDLDEVSLLYHRHESNMTNQKSVIELGAVRVYKLHLERLRAGAAPADAREWMQVGFPQYIGQTVVPHDQGMREPVVHGEAAR